MSFEDIFSYIGGVGVYQITIMVFLGISPFIAAIQTFIMIFLGPDYNHWCNIDRLANFSHAQQKYIAIPYNQEINEYDRCVYYNLPYDTLTDEQLWNWNWTLIDPNITHLECDSGWIFDQSEYVSTVISEYELVCSRSNLQPLAYMLHTAGYTLSFLVVGPLSDYFGRRTLILIACILQFPVSFGAAYCSGYVCFVVLRFILGIVNCLLSSSSFVLLMELFGEQYRAIPGACYWLNWCFGIISLPVVAYFVRDFRNLQIVFSCLGLVILSFFFIIPESPRWLLTKGKTEKAIHILEEIAEINDKILPNNILEIINPKSDHNHDQHQNVTDDNRNENFDTKDNEFTVVGCLLKFKILIKIISICIPVWIGNSLIYYGLSLNTGSVAGSLYMVTFLSGLVEIPANIAALFFMLYFNHKLTVFWGMILSSSMCLLCIPFIGTDITWMVTVLSLFGKGFITLSFTSVGTYTLELLPTIVRHFGYGFISTIASFGSLIAPYAGPPMQDIWPPLPLVIFGITGIVTAFLLLMCLPDTFKRDMPDTIDDLNEQHDNSYSLKRRQYRDKTDGVSIQYYNNEAFNAD